MLTSISHPAFKETITLSYFHNTLLNSGHSKSLCSVGISSIIKTNEHSQIHCLHPSYIVVTTQSMVSAVMPMFSSIISLPAPQTAENSTDMKIQQTAKIATPVQSNVWWQAGGILTVAQKRVVSVQGSEPGQSRLNRRTAEMLVLPSQTAEVAARIHVQFTVR